MAVFLRSMNPQHQRAMGLTSMIEGYINRNNSRENADHGQSLFQQDPSLAGTNLSRYNENNNVDDANKLNDVKTRKHPVTGHQQPYDKERSFLS